MNKILFEACVDSVDSAIAAEKAGANRIELCSDLLEGGITPGAGMIRLTIEKINIPVNVLIRPRGGDFLYSSTDYEVMKQDILFCKNAGAGGVVVGILNESGAIDRERTKNLVDLARPMSITFHRAFDVSRDAFESLNTLIGLGVDRILTSGQESSAFMGINTIKRLIEHASQRLIIMPGGGVNENNIYEIIKGTGAKEIHASARESVKSKMNYRNTKLSMSDSGVFNECEIKIASEERIRKMIKAIR